MINANCTYQIHNTFTYDQQDSTEQHFFENKRNLKYTFDDLENYTHTCMQKNSLHDLYNIMLMQHDLPL